MSITVLTGKDGRQYGTKLHPWLREVIPALRASNNYGSEREVLEDMARAFAQVYPERMERARTFMRDFQKQDIPDDVLGVVDVQAMKEKIEDAAERIVPTVKYKGKEAVHLYVEGRKNSTRCSVPGEVDEDSVGSGPASSVTCGKCRYAGKVELGL